MNSSKGEVRTRMRCESRERVVAAVKAADGQQQLAVSGQARNHTQQHLLLTIMLRLCWWQPALQCRSSASKAYKVRAALVGRSVAKFANFSQNKRTKRKFAKTLFHLYFCFLIFRLLNQFVFFFLLFSLLPAAVSLAAIV